MAAVAVTAFVLNRQADARVAAALEARQVAEGQAVNLRAELGTARDQLAKQPAERVVTKVVYRPVRVSCLPAFERAARLYAGGQP